MSWLRKSYICWRFNSSFINDKKEAIIKLQYRFVPAVLDLFRLYTLYFSIAPMVATIIISPAPTPTATIIEFWELVTSERPAATTYIRKN